MLKKVFKKIFKRPNYKKLYFRLKEEIEKINNKITGLEIQYDNINILQIEQMKKIVKSMLQDYKYEEKSKKSKIETGIDNIINY